MGKRDPRIDAYIAASREFARPILERIRADVHAACPDCEETLKWGMPAFLYHGILCGMAAFKGHAALWFWKGGEIVGDANDREAMGNFGRMTKPSDLPTRTRLKGYVKKAMARNASGVKSPRQAKPGKPAPRTPADLAAALRKNARARATFEAFSPSHRREYVEWITEAKQAGTRARRVATAIEWMAEGKGQNWRYERPKKPTVTKKPAATRATSRSGR